MYKRGCFTIRKEKAHSLTHLALQEETGHCFRFFNDSQGISPKNVPHFGANIVYLKLIGDILQLLGNLGRLLGS